MDLFPAGRRIVRHDDPNRLYLVDLAAPDLVDVHRRHVEGLLFGHVGLLPIRIAGDLELLLRHRMPEMRKANRQAGDSVGDFNAAIVDRGDVLESPGIKLRRAILHA